MSDKKQSSVDWLLDRIEDVDSAKIWNDIKQQAKEMHKEEIMEFVYSAVRKILDEDRQNPFNLEQYYNETYGGNNERMV